MAVVQKPGQKKRVVVRSVVRTVFQRPEPAHVEALKGHDVTAISEVVGRMYTMNGSIRPLSTPAIPVVGVASTAKCPAGDNLGMIKALTLVQPGDVLVVDAQGFTDWCLGGYQLLKYSQTRHGLRGLIVNGAYRDVGEARVAGFPVYAAGVAPFSGPKVGPGEVNVPVCCGGVIVQPGDVIAASEEGIAVVPYAAVPDVVRALAASAASTRYTRTARSRTENADYIAQFVDRLVQEFDADTSRKG